MVNTSGFIRSLIYSDVNPSNQKSRTLPLLNFIDKYGRAFHLSWIGFFVAFLSWFAFPPLLHGVIKDDLKLTQAQIANSNIVGLLATVLVRLIIGPLCDKYGPRYVMIGCLLAGAIPTAFVPLINNASGLTAIRFFIGILGGTFVPCQVWTSQFFDKNIVGLVNALAAGWGNAGGGVTFFVMPAIVSSLQNNRNISQYWAWRISFLVCPLIIIICIALVMLIFGDDTPTGSWSSRTLGQNTNDIETQVFNEANTPDNNSMNIKTIESSLQSRQEITSLVSNEGNLPEVSPSQTSTKATALETTPILDEFPQAPSLADLWRTALSPKTLLVALTYLCSFGSELAVEGIISDLYIQTANRRNNMIWSSQIAGNWAAMFGLLNIFTRPLGGYISDILYRKKGVVAKKWWLIILGVIQGVFFIWIGLTNLEVYSLIGAMTGLAIFMEAANGAIFSLVPHIHPKFNGVVSGVAGAAGSIGGILFGLVFRFEGTNYLKTLWIIGICCFGSNVAVAWIKV